MLAAIEAARAYVLLEMYLVSSGGIATRFIEALHAAARTRGALCVVIRRLWRPASFARPTGGGSRRRGASCASSIRSDWRSRLAQPPARPSQAPRGRRRVAFVGGAGLTDEFAPGPATALARAHDRDPRSRGGGLGARLRAHLAALGAELPLPEAPSYAAPGRRPGRLSLSEAREHSALASGVVRRIDAAQSRVWMVSAYFVPSRRYRKALRRAARRGVDVRLADAERAHRSPVGAPRGTPLLRQDAAQRRAHLRVPAEHAAREDDPVRCWLSIGSSNLDRWSFKWNLEANQEVADGRAGGRGGGAVRGRLSVSAALSRRRGASARARSSARAHRGALDRCSIAGARGLGRTAALEVRWSAAPRKAPSCARTTAGRAPCVSICVG